MSVHAATGEDVRDTHLDEAELHARLTRTWATGASLIDRLSSVDHKVVGRRYILTAFVFLCLGGLSAVVMRMQLARPEAKLLGPDLYNQLFTMHGTTMMFLFAVPVMEAFAVYLVPLMLGTRNIAFPRLNAFSYWVYLFGGTFLWVAFMLKIGPDVGWFAYVPLSGPDFSPGKRVDVWAQMITFTEVSALAVAVEIIVVVFKQRAPGMTLDRIPLFVWAMLVMSFLVIFAMPADVRIPAAGPVIDRRWILGVRTLGAPHVRHRAAAARQRVLHRVEHADRGAERYSNLLLAGNAVGRQAEVQDAAAVRARVLLHLHHRRNERRDGRLGADRYAG